MSLIWCVQFSCVMFVFAIYLAHADPALPSIDFRAEMRALLLAFVNDDDDSENQTDLDRDDRDLRKRHPRSISSSTSTSSSSSSSTTTTTTTSEWHCEVGVQLALDEFEAPTRVHVRLRSVRPVM
jgi:hypothetical protein